jgi:hypothetical protein
MKKASKILSFVSYQNKSRSKLKEFYACLENFLYLRGLPVQRPGFDRPLADCLLRPRQPPRRLLPGRLAAIVIIQTAFLHPTATSGMAKPCTIANRGVPIRILMMVNGFNRNYQLEVGETLCIPPEGEYTFYDWDCYYSDPVFEAYAFGKRVYIEGSDFPRSNTYFVRVAPYGSGAWKRVGSVTASRRGQFSASFKIPSSMRKYPVLMVCIKNVDNDRVYCTAVFNT